MHGVKDFANRGNAVSKQNHTYKVLVESQTRCLNELCHGSPQVKSIRTKYWLKGVSKENRFCFIPFAFKRNKILDVQDK